MVAHSTSGMFTGREFLNDKLRHSFPSFSISFKHFGYSLFNLANLVSMSMYIHTDTRLDRLQLLLQCGCIHDLILCQVSTCNTLWGKQLMMMDVFSKG